MKPALIAVALVAGYAALGFLAVPALLESQARQFVAQQYGRELTLGDVRFNPFSLRLELDGVALPDADGAPMLAADALAVDVQASSLWRRRLVFSEITLAGPRVRAEVRADGRFNLADLALPDEDDADEPPPPVEIERLELAAGELVLADLSQARPFRATLEPLRFELRDFHTRTAGDNAGEFSASTAAGERIAWRGRLDVAPFRSTGTLSLTGLRAATVAALVDPPLPLELGPGQLDLSADYELVATEPLRLEVALPEVVLTGFALRPRGGARDLVTLPRVAVSDTRLSLAGRSLRIGKVQLAAPQVLAERRPDGSLELADLAGTPATDAVAVADAAAPVAPVAAQPWSVAVAAVEVREASVALTDRSVAPAAAIRFAPLSLDVTGWSTAPDAQVAVKLDAAHDAGGRVAAEGSMALATREFAATLAATRLPLARAQPYLEPVSGIRVQRGTLDLEGQLRGGGATPLAFDGGLAVDGLAVADRRLGESLLRWRRLEVQGLAWRAQPARLAIEQIVAREPYARVLIAPDGRLNLGEALRRPGAEPGTEAASVADGEDAPPAPVAAAAPAPAAASPALAARIGRVRIERGTLDFADLSLTPSFQAGIQQLGGSIVGLSSDPAQRARVDLKGQVDQFSPVVIAGEVNYLAATAYTDLALSFRNMELTTFNPYSVKWAGYRIAKGKLTTELRYKVVDRQLDADHRVIIDQLEFGERTNSPDAITLPLKLAVALLKDRHGVIDVQLPVAGSLDDPKFRLGPIVWQVVRNLLTKIVTAPFALLGSLFGGGPDINLLDFAPGSAELDAASRDKLAAVARALAERPQLKLEVPLASVATLDAPALAAARFEALLAVRGAGQPADAAPVPVLEPGARLAALERWYRAEFGQKPAVPLPAGVEPRAAKEQAAQPAYRIAWLEAQLRPKAEVGAAELQALAKARSDAVLAQLLTDTGVDPARVFVTANRQAAEAGGAVRAELRLE